MKNTLTIAHESVLSDWKNWTNRFLLLDGSETLTIAQHKELKYWSCSCPSWTKKRKCKHLISLELPCGMQPYEPTIIHS